METLNNRYIAVSYRLTAREGEQEAVIEETKEDEPFCFVSAVGMTLDEFEQQVVDHAEGETFSFTLNRPGVNFTLTFDGQVLENRPAAPDEIQEAIRLVTQAQQGGCGGCGGGGCGGCGGCGSESGCDKEACEKGGCEGGCCDR
jgi:FKBP-type peptidyl-prolyl cis-trans isomerase SlyD